MAKAFQKLGRLQMRRLGAGEKLTEHGITFERLQNGDGLFSVNVMVDGVRIHRVIGRESDGTTRTQAEEFIERARTEARHDRLGLHSGRKTALSFRLAAARYLKDMEATGGKNVAVKRRHLEQHLVPFLGELPLSKVDGFAVERYKKHRLAEPSHIGGDRRSRDRAASPTDGARTIATGTVNRELATLSHLFTVALERKWIATAKPRMKRLKEGDGRIVYLTADQAGRFLEAANASGSPHLYAFLRIALATAMRKTEVLSIRKEHIDLGKRTIYIPDAKAGARDQPMTASLASFLAEYLEKSVNRASPWLFPSPITTSRAGHLTSIEKPFRVAVAEAGLDLKQVVRHTLRHTAISHLVQSGVDLPTVKRISGHKTLAMVEKYAHQSGAHIQAAMDKLQHSYTGITPAASRRQGQIARKPA